jgi:hypothetical protein
MATAFTQFNIHHRLKTNIHTYWIMHAIIINATGVTDLGMNNVFS